MFSRKQNLCDFLIVQETSMMTNNIKIYAEVLLNVTESSLMRV